MTALRNRNWAWMVMLVLVAPLIAQEADKKTEDTGLPATTEAQEKAAEPEIPLDLDTEGMVALEKDGGVWMDRKRKWIVIDGTVSVQRGALEMFACPKQTKEHESVIAVDAKASVVHAGLIAIGAKPGTPSTFVPEYQPVSGPEIGIWVLWKDKDGKPQKARAQQWVRNAKTGKEMDVPWIFGGSKIWVHPTTGERHYQGDGGDFICVSNFPTATMDVPVPSTQSDEGLLYEAFTERVPDPGTKVRLVLVPKIEEKQEETNP